MSFALPTLDDRIRDADRLVAVRKSELVPGDAVLVQTRNSVYAIRALGNGFYEVSGGWFDRHGGRAQVVTINGCTWGGSAIKQDLVAARGLFLEFGNRVVTTRILCVVVVRGEARRRPGRDRGTCPGSSTDPSETNYRLN